MALLAIEGFEHGDITLLDNAYSLSDSNIGTTYGRLGGKGIYLGSSDYFDIVPENQTSSTWIMGFAWKVNSIPTPFSTLLNSSYCPIIIYDANGSIIAGIQYTGLGIAKFFRHTGSSDGEQLGNNFNFVANRWYYIELKLVVHDTTGSGEWKIDGIANGSTTGVDTKTYSSDYIGSVRFNECGNERFDDIYIENANFLGDVRIKGFMPDSDGTHSDFTRNTGSNDYECVDEAPSTDDTDYIEADTVGNKSTFGITTGALSTVKAIKVLNQVRKTDAGSREARSIVRSNGSNYNGTTKSISDDYHKLQHIWETDPDDSNAWNQSKLEAAEFGLEIVT